MAEISLQPPNVVGVVGQVVSLTISIKVLVVDNGVVVLEVRLTVIDTDDVKEGTVNLYHTSFLAPHPDVLVEFEL